MNTWYNVNKTKMIVLDRVQAYIFSDNGVLTCYLVDGIMIFTGDEAESLKLAIDSYLSQKNFDDFLKNLPTTPVVPDVMPVPVTNGCHVCGIKFDGVMGYVCQRTDCPSAIRCS